MQVLSLIIAVAALQGGAQQPTQTPGGPTPSIRIYNAVRSDKDVKLDLLLDNAAIGKDVGPDMLSGPFKLKDPKSATVIVKKAGDSNNLTQKQIDVAGK